MKIVVSSDNELALKQFREQIKIKNEFAQKQFTPIVNQLVAFALNRITDDEVLELANKLVAPEVLKKSKLKRYEVLLDEMSEDELLKLERRVERNKNSQKI